MHPLIEQNRDKIAALCRQYAVMRLGLIGRTPYFSFSAVSTRQIF